MKYLFILLAVFLNLKGNTQTISGKVKDEAGKPLEGVTISLTNASDSMIKRELSNASGTFIFQNLSAGHYRIHATYVSHQMNQKVYFQLDSSIVLPDLVMKKASRELSAIVVSGRKPLIQVKGGKTIINVESSVNASGNTLLEVLRKSPGVSMDKDDNISMNGKNAVRIYIDGRPIGLSGVDLITYLNSIQSSNVEAVELITNPSARYEAAGNAGIINIRLKKNTAYGTNGTLNTGYQIGSFPKYQTGINWNHRNRKINLFGNYNYSGGLTANSISIYRTAMDTVFDQNGKVRENNNGHQFKMGMDYTLNKRSILGAGIHGNVSTPVITNTSNMSISSLSTGMVDRFLMADNLLDQERNNMAFHLNYAYQEEKGKSLSLNADHAFYHLRGDQYQPNDYFNTNGMKTHRVVYQMVAPTDIRISSLNGDYEQNVKEGKLSLGGKWASITTDNDFRRYNVYDQHKELDKDRSNRFRYQEAISAAFLQYAKNVKGFSVQTGLRLEHTRSEGRSAGMKNAGTEYIPFDSSFRRSYTNLFPSASVTFNKNIMRQWTVSFSRRIDRPAYQELNPFEFKVDEYTSQKGSVDLLPQYTSSLGITYIHKQKLTAALNYSRIKDMFVQLMDTIERTRAVVVSKNLGSQDVVSLSLTYPLQYKSYSLIANMEANYKKLAASLGQGRDIDLDITGVRFYAQNSLKFKNTWTAEITGFYNSPMIYGTNLRVRSMWSMDAGLQKQLFGGKANLKFAVSDVFNALRFEGSSFFAGQQTTFTRKNETRQAKIGFSWKFGSKTVKAARQYKTAVQEEMNRVQ